MSRYVTTGEGHQELALVPEGTEKVKKIAGSALVRVNVPSLLKCGGLIPYLTASITKYLSTNGSQKPMIAVLFQVGQAE